MGLAGGDVESPTFLVAYDDYTANPTVAKARSICQEFLQVNGDLSLTISSADGVAQNIQDAVRQIRTSVGNLGDNDNAPANIFDTVVDQVKNDITGNQIWNVVRGRSDPPGINLNTYLQQKMPGVNRLVQAGINIKWIFDVLP